MLIPQLLVLLHCLGNNLFQFRGNVRIESHWSYWLFCEDRFEYLTRGPCVKWKLAGRHFIENYPEGVEIRSRIELFSPRLFGRHVGDCTQCHARRSKFLDASRI